MNDSGRLPTDTDGSGHKPFSVSVVKAAELAGCGKTFMWELIGTGEMPSFQFGRARRVRVADIETYLARLVEEDREARAKASA